MTDAEKLSLAYQLVASDPVNFPDAATALVQVNADEAALFAVAAPAPTDVIGTKHMLHPDGTVEKTEFMGDGTERPMA